MSKDRLSNFLQIFFWKKNITFLNLLCIIFFQVISAQKYTSGKITDDTGQPIPFAHLRIEDTNIGIVSNESGLFKLTFDSQMEEKALIISAIGYRTEKLPLRKGHLIIRLDPEISQLEEVIVFSRIKGKISF